ncbi:MAG: DUF2304 family protein [Candidatus Gracilibacteria bacterium]|nr:DUF2304 family protein [Candidatus Gracilibacteria bacterium]
MQLSPLQFILVVSGLVFFIFAIDSFQRKRFNALHFLVFFGGVSVILLFSLDVQLLNKFGSLFGVARGADLLVYISIILLAYFYFEILNKITKQSFLTTRLITEQAIQRALSHNEITNLKLNDNEFSDFIFLVRSYNEGKYLNDVIDEILDYGFSKIVIVNDGSVDNTVRSVLDKKLQHDGSDIILLSHLINRGGGSANKTGFEFLRRYGDSLKVKWVVTFDADGQMDINDMKTFIYEINKNAGTDVFLGTRFLLGGSASNIPLSRKIILSGSRVITYFFNSLWVTDPHNGYRVLSIDAVKNIKIDSDGMTYASELLDEVKRLNLKYKEIPVNIKYTEYSLKKAHGQKNSNAWRILLELIYKKFFYK